MRTFSPKQTDVERAWWVVDAEDCVLGRLSSEVAKLLRGKHKEIFAPHIDVGDHVIIVNAAKVLMTSDKPQRTHKHWHSGYPGGIKSATYAELLEKDPEQLVRDAVKGMLPKNKLGRKMLSKLKVHAGPDHPHSAQSPRTYDVSRLRRAS